eukprot:1019234-Prymnesium_polylepis.1
MAGGGVRLAVRRARLPSLTYAVHSPTFSCALPRTPSASAAMQLSPQPPPSSQTGGCADGTPSPAAMA